MPAPPLVDNRMATVAFGKGTDVMRSRPEPASDPELLAGVEDTAKGAANWGIGEKRAHRTGASR